MLFRTLSLSLCLFCLTAPGATYYVATNGNDSAAGTIGAPWITIQHGINSAGSGDVVSVGQGFYPDDGNHHPTFNLNVAGAIVDGNGLAQIARAEISATGCVLRGFHCGINNWEGVAYGAAIHFETGADHCTVSNCIISSDIGPSGGTQYGVGWNTPSTNCLIYGCLFTNFSSQSIDVCLAGTSNTLMNCQFINNPNVERVIDAAGYFNRICGCLFSNNNNMGDGWPGGGHPDLFQCEDEASHGMLIESNLMINCSCAIGSLTAQASTGFGGPAFDAELRSPTHDVL
jgi:hypothetical protein